AAASAVRDRLPEFAASQRQPDQELRRGVELRFSWSSYGNEQYSTRSPAAAADSTQSASLSSAATPAAFGRAAVFVGQADDSGWPDLIARSAAEQVAHAIRSHRSHPDQLR